MTTLAYFWEKTDWRTEGGRLLDISKDQTTLQHVEGIIKYVNNGPRIEAWHNRYLVSAPSSMTLVEFKEMLESSVLLTELRASRDRLKKMQEEGHTSIKWGERVDKNAKLW